MKEKSLSISEQIDLLPVTAGIYKFYDSEKKLLYIGKAINLRNRVSSYFTDAHTDRPHIIPMIPQICIIETVQTDTEVEALILEAALVKKYQPPFNQMLKDDKSYAWIYIASKEKIPTVKIVRTLDNREYKRGKLFGPYPSGFTIKRVYRFLRKLFPFCNCKNEREEILYHQIGLCPGPNIGKISLEEYKQNIKYLTRFLSGNLKTPINELEVQMKTYAKNEKFEQAARLRDRINDLKYISQKININFFETEEVYQDKREKIYLGESEILAQEFEKIGLDDRFRELGRIECYDISNLQGSNSYCSMSVAINGLNKTSLYRVFKIKNDGKSDDPGMLKEAISRRLKHIGADTDESLNSKPDIILIDGGKSQLSVVGEVIPEQIAFMGITKGRKYKRRGGKKRDEFWVDVSFLSEDKQKEFEMKKREQIKTSSSKRGNKSRNSITSEVLDSRNIIQINIKNNRILSALRDEAHRFAIKAFRKNKLKSVTKSEMDKIDGVGAKTYKKLITHFGSVDKIKISTEQEINEVVKNRTVSKNVREFFSSQERT